MKKTFLILFMAATLLFSVGSPALANDEWKVFERIGLLIFNVDPDNPPPVADFVFDITGVAVNGNDQIAPPAVGSVTLRSEDMELVNHDGNMQWTVAMEEKLFEGVDFPHTGSFEYLITMNIPQVSEGLFLEEFSITELVATVYVQRVGADLEVTSITVSYPSHNEDTIASKAGSMYFITAYVELYEVDIHQQVTGDYADMGREFDVKIEVEDVWGVFDILAPVGMLFKADGRGRSLGEPIELQFNDQTNLYEIELRMMHGDRITFSSVIHNTEFTITAEDASDALYITEINGNQVQTLTSAITTKPAEFVVVQRSDAQPTTGVIMIGVPFVLLIAVLGTVAYVVTRKREDIEDEI